MKIQKIAHLIILLCIITQTQAAEQLFNHHDLSGWTHVGPGSFSVENGLLVSRGGMGLLYYHKKKFTNIKLHIVFKTAYPTTNSGVFVRIPYPPKDAWDAVNHAFEIQICDKGKDAFDAYHRTGSIYSFAKSKIIASHKPGEWNTYDIYMRENTIKVFLNGVNVSRFNTDAVQRRGIFPEDPKRGKRQNTGFIGIQNHDHNALFADSHVYVKDVVVESLEGSRNEL